MTPLTPEQIAKKLATRDSILSRRDGLIDWPRIKRIEAQLATVPAGTNNDVDLALGRLEAVLPEQKRVVMAERSEVHSDGKQRIDAQFAAKSGEVWSSDAERATWKRDAEATGKQLAQDKRDDFLEWVADQTEDLKDFLNIRGDCAI